MCGRDRVNGRFAVCTALSALMGAYAPVSGVLQKCGLTVLREAGVAGYGYCRVSTMMQGEEGESLDVQARRIEGYAHMQGLPLCRTFVDRGVSGSKPLA